MVLYLVQKMIEDEKTRKRIFYIIAVPIVFLILLVSMIAYLFTLPQESLQEHFGDKAGIVEFFIDIYGYEFGYQESGRHIFNTDYEIGDYSNYDAFDADMFASLMNEATKYIGYPYVWGGSTPETSFDCSGFICWTYTKSGVYNIPRTTAQGIFNQCVPLPESEAKAGDLIFFHSTYNSVGKVSHVGIYLGDGTFLHCGNPIGYANLNSAYWRNHFYACGRLPIFEAEGG